MVLNLDSKAIGEITISKDLMFKFLDGMKKHWDKNPNNKNFSQGITLMKAGLHLQDDNVVQTIVSEMFRAVIALEQMGAFEDMGKDEMYDDRIKFFANTLLPKIESGEFFNGVENYVK